MEANKTTVSVATAEKARPTEKQQQFRQAMSRLCAAVNIITTSGPAGRCGITATAMCSVTDTPPTVLVCVNRSSSMNAVFKKNGGLCINILGHDQESLARHFAGMTDLGMDARFDLDVWHSEQERVPVLREAAVALVGRISRVDEIGSHSVMYVEIDDVLIDGTQGALLYRDRAFHQLAPAMQPTD